MQLAYLMPPIQLEPTNLIMMQFMQSLLTAGAQQHGRVRAGAARHGASVSPDSRAARSLGGMGRLPDPSVATTT